jgi:ceramide glucosyltransferase
MLLILSLAAAVYLVAAFLRLHFLKAEGEKTSFNPPVSVLKPVCGLEMDLEENLRSFCVQDYPEFQVIFGVRDKNDPAVPVIRKVMADFPDGDLQLIIGGSVSGPNFKIGNLARMLPAARHDILVVADSDMRVGQDYLAAVSAPFADPGIGAVTCPYSGTPRNGIASSLGALYLTDWFLPAALVSAGLRDPDFCFGSTMAVRRTALEAIGGFEALMPCLADDFQLGYRIDKAGWKVCLVPYVVENIVAESSLRALVAHEVRWARTVRACRPGGYLFRFLADSGMTFAGLYLVFADWRLSGWVLVGVVFGLRLLLHYRLRRLVRVPPAATPWLLLIRDFLCLWVWTIGLFGSKVRWRNRVFKLNDEGTMVEVAPPERFLVVTADDFGRTLPVNEAVERAYHQGILRVADLMVGGEAVADAIRRARKMPDLRIGLHLVLTRWRPVLPAAQIPALTGTNGCFPKNLVAAGFRYYFRPGVRRQLTREIRAQFQAFAATGLTLDHLSVHNHLQLHPTILRLALTIGREFGLPAVRVPWEPPVDGTFRVGRLVASCLLYPLAVLSRRRIRRAGMLHNDRLFGLFGVGKMDAPRLRDLLGHLPPGLNELHLHPATESIDAGADESMPGWRPEAELAALIDPAVRFTLQAAGVRCGGYGDFAADRERLGVVKPKKLGGQESLN